MRAQFRVKLAVGLAVVMVAAALAAPAQAAMKADQKSTASQGAPGAAGPIVVIGPPGFKGQKISPQLPTLSVAGWTVTPYTILGFVQRAGFLDRAMMPIPHE